MSEDAAYSLLASLEGVRGKARPPVHLWHPEAEKDIDMAIHANGDWYHEGTRITRQRLVHLFASVLRREGDDYFLVTPVEKCRIRVEAAPFVIVQLEDQGQGDQQVLQVTTNVGDTVVINAEHPLQVVSASDEAPDLRVEIHDGLQARFNRSTYYHLVELGIERHIKNSDWFGVWSSGRFYRLTEV